MRDLLDQLEDLQSVLLSCATGGAVDEVAFASLRQAVLNDSSLTSAIPAFLRTCRSLAQFWVFIKNEHSTYAERRSFIWTNFAPLLEIAERPPVPSDSVISSALQDFDPESVNRIWAKAMERREPDPEGAITASRTLVETVCKHILDEEQVSYDHNADLPALYKHVAQILQIAPSQHTELVFKQILGGCTAVIEGLGSLRNRLGDAHGQGKAPVKPAPRHAELAVNLSGALSTFLVSTYRMRQSRRTRD